MRYLDRFDVVHSHLEFFGFPVARASDGRVLSTLHNRQDVPEAILVHQEFPEVPLVSISDAQRTPVPNSNWVATVYNGIDVDDFTFRSEPGTYLAFLGRVSPDKGLDTAIRVAARARMPLKVAARLPRGGESTEEVRDRQYYQEQILPLLSQNEVEFVAQISGTARDDLLGGAAALLFPVRWPEPFGLVMPEAMACGTPVIALRCGSVPEVVEDGVTGFVRDNEEELVEAVSRIGEIDRAGCRIEVARRFSCAAMADGYEDVYAGMCASDERVMAVAD
jgi:glycosyltransferase involved in cell wall biosynthesis